MTTASDDELRFAIARAARRIRLERVEGDLSERMLSTLFVLHLEGAQTLGSLSEHERVSPPSMNRTVNHLVAEGLASRIEDPDDRRRVLIDVTEAGRAIVLETRRRRSAWFSDRVAELTADERAALEAAAPILRRLADS